MIIKKKSIREQVYENLKEEIVNGKIQSGEKIIELEYAEKFGVSRTPLREALRMLELEGLVTNAEKGGVTVNYISKEDIEEIYKIRVALESIVLKEIIKKDESCLEALHSILEETRIALDENMESEALIEIFQRFNHELYEAANLKQVSKLIKHLNEYTKRFRVLCLKNEIRLKEAFLEHWNLVEALEKKDLEEALRINDKHLFRSMKLVLNKMPDTK
ncbi:GntR family transcriptional regulator [Fusobacterium necrophorum]|uniref:GntR family transcriptional regulator n=1 Tax=Fusobacterium necrophorum TaxID=859 RepID=A0A4Q2L245_9FUSO|nr:GntR family transcriptional regulator [Fusobacterium necrophorum]RXZ70342.1 GntR family transcriptional regulator [Fusobacterium necrophorum]